MPTRNRFVRWGITLLLFCGCASAWAQRVPSATDPKAVVAETQQDAKRQGVLRTGRITWKCSDRLCIATSKNIAVGVNTCQALAELVGSLSRFGRVERPIPSYDLALCNVRAQIKLAKLEQQRADAETARAKRLSPRPSLAEDASAAADGASSSAAASVAGTTAARPGGSSHRLSGPKPLDLGTLPSPAVMTPARPDAAYVAPGRAPAPRATASAPAGSASTLARATGTPAGAASAPVGTAGIPAGAEGAPTSAGVRSSGGPAAPAANAQRGSSTAARGSTSSRRPPPVIEASPIAPSYRPSIYAIRVTPLAVVGRSGGAMAAEPAPSVDVSASPANEPALASSPATEPSPDSGPVSGEMWGTELPGASSSRDALSPPADEQRTAAAARTDIVPGSAQSALGDDVDVDAPAQSLPGSANSSSAAARPAQSASGTVVVPGLVIVGHGRMQEPVRGTHLTVTVDRLEVIGKREGDQ